MGRYCSLAEYVSGVDDRFTVEELQVGERYLFMAAFKPNVHSVEAFECPARMDDIEIPKHGSALIHFAILDDDTANEHPYNGKFDDGFWRDAYKNFAVQDIRTAEAYFRFDEPSLDKELLSLQAGIVLPVALRH